jgi:hypothetical protein
MYVEYELVVEKEELVVIKASANMMVDGNKLSVSTYGEVSPKNYQNYTSKFGSYPFAMAEKRALSRAVLKLSGFYRLGNVFGEGEVDDRTD